MNPLKSKSLTCLLAFLGASPLPAGSNGAFQLLRHRGSAEKPIVFRPAPGERATLDGGLVLGSDREEDFPDPNEHDPARAHLAIFNWPRKETVSIPVDGVLKPENRYRLIDPADFFGEAVLTGTCQGTSIDLPLDREFAAFVLIREPSPGERVPENR